MGRRGRTLTQILSVPGFKVSDWFFEDAQGARREPSSWQVPRDWKLVLELERRWLPRCGGCWAGCRRIKERLEQRRWKDLPWCERAVELRYAPVRVRCDRCGSAPVEQLPFADTHQRQTRRFQHYVAVLAASAPVLHVAALMGVSWDTVRRAEGHALRRWSEARPVAPLRRIGIDEKYLGRRTSKEASFVTIVSNLDTGEPVWVGLRREIAMLKKWIDTLSIEQKRGIELFASDMYSAFRKAIRADSELDHAAIVHDPFHLVKRAGKAVDEVRREVFFRANDELRVVGRGKRWLFLLGANKLNPLQQLQLNEMLRMNRRLAHAYQVKEHIRYAMTRCTSRESMEIELQTLLRRTQRKNNKPMRRLHESLRMHTEGILALGVHRPPTGRIEALNNNWETLVRRGRGYRDLDYLMLKLQFAIANPIRRKDGVDRFLSLAQPAAQPVAA